MGTEMSHLAFMVPGTGSFSNINEREIYVAVIVIVCRISEAHASL